ncbi:macrolide family glycosyltransferase [Catenuloplanes japonicus]|uniref:macrolide family glycosyltransferase n=1 Tax=Catenuloplanes japonicus TaxID=33876 RepID=UPI0006902CBE|nr:macrolide family glycosyltransferase [Catenuloplanes japonicus]
MSLTVAFLVPPTVGHVNPTLPLVRELIGRGHRVRYVAGPATADRVEQAGAEPIRVPLAVEDLIVDEAGFSTTRMAEMLDHFADAVRAITPQVVDALSADRPDVLCHDGLFFVGSSVAAHLGVPEVRVVPHFAENAKVSLGARMVRHGLDPLDARMGAFGANAFRLSQEAGPPRDPATVPSLVFLPRSFQIDGDAFDDTFTFVGPEAPDAERGTPEKLVYVSLGSILSNRPDFYRLCAEAFADTGWHVIMSVGEHIDPGTLAAPNIEAGPWFPQRDVLRRAAAFVSHAGMNSLMDALVAQVPVIALPLTAEQGLNAERLAEVGAGQVGDLRTLTAAGLRGLVERTAADARIADVLKDSFGPRTSTGGARRAADVIEAHARTR